MSLQKVEGKAIVVGDEVYLITHDKALPRHYVVAATMLATMLLPQILRGDDIPALLYAGFISLATLGLSWLFDDRDRYRLRHLIDVSMPKAAEAKET